MLVYLLAAAAAYALYLLLSSILAWYRLRQFKGPFLASFSYLWLAQTTLSGKSWKIQMETRKKYGKGLIRIAPDLLVTDDAELIRRMSAARSPYKRSGWYTSLRMDPYQHSMMSTLDTAFHDDIKSKTSLGYSGKEVPTLEADVDGQIANLKDLIRRKYLSTDTSTKPVDFAKPPQYFTLDSISKIAYGKEFGFLAADCDVNGYISTMDAMSLVFAFCANIPFARKIFFSPFVLKLAGPKPTDPAGPGLLMGLARDVVAKRFGPDAKDQRDMLGSFIRHGLPQKQCESEVLLQIIAGSDTTANVIRSTMLYIVSSPQAYLRLQKEIDDAISDGKISAPITNAEAKTLPYLQAVIFEGLRLHPPSFILASKLAPPEGDTFDGEFIPGGTQIAQDNWSLFRKPELFGDDASVFRPERWLVADADKKAEMEKITELIFGYGRWMCAGKTVAFVELNKIFVELLRDFDFQLINPKMPWNEYQYVLFMISNMWMRVTERKK